MNPVYLPREDSDLLAKTVKKFAYGKCLDVGTGSGIQAITAAMVSKVTSVLAIDINPVALKYAKKNNPHNKISYKKSDLFSNVKNKFDTIIFNPPYLPNEPKLKDLALDGGKKGYELTINFIESVNDYLDDKGQILLLISSYTKKHVIEQSLEDNLFDYELISKQKLDFEKLYVYKITKSKILKKLSKEFKNISLLAKGKRGVVYKSGKIAIKVKRKSSDINTIKHETNILKEVNKLRIGPKLLKSTPDYLAMQFIEGKRILEYLSKNKKDTIKIILETLKQLRKLDLANIQKQEMTNPYKHVIIDKGKITLIDFERARKKPNPANITQFLDFITSETFREIKKFDKKKIIELSKEYRNEQSEKNYFRIISSLQ